MDRNPSVGRTFVNRSSSAQVNMSSWRQDESFANNLIMVAALAYKQMRDAIAPKPRGFTAIGVFLFFGAVMATFTATTLLRRGTPLDRLWALNPIQVGAERN